MKYKKIIKPIVFLVFFCILFFVVQFPFQMTAGIIGTKNMLNSFYAEKDDSLDAVYVGASNVHAFFQPLLAWEDSGITSQNYSADGMSPYAVPYVMEEVRKTQPDTLFIVNINSIKPSGIINTPANIHWLTDAMPFSMTKVRMVHDLASRAGMSRSEELEFFFPIIRYHSSWPELTSNLFTRSNKPNGFRGSRTSYSFMANVEDISSEYNTNSASVSLTVLQQDVLDRILDYADANGIKVLFVVVPQTIENESLIGQYNTAADYVKSRGYDCLNLMDETEAVGLDLTSDYYDSHHTNIHGSLKFTHYICEYLKEHYHFTDKRNDEAYAGWNESYRQYYEMIGCYAVDFELEHLSRCDTLDAPVLSLATVYGNSIKVFWKTSKQAEGYCIYRKSVTEGQGNPYWEKIADLKSSGSGSMNYEDTKLLENVKYTYTVVPYLTENEEKQYGRFDVGGISAVTLPSPVVLHEAIDTPEGVFFSWEPAEGAAGYRILRKISGEQYQLLEDVGPETTSWTDPYTIPGLPYIYTVRVLKEYNGKTVYGSAPDGVILARDLSMSDVKAENAATGIRLSWEPVKGATGYVVSKLTEQGYEVISGAKDLTKTAYFDKETVTGNEYTYLVLAIVSSGTERLEFPAEPITVKREVSE